MPKPPQVYMLLTGCLRVWWTGKILFNAQDDMHSNRREYHRKDGPAVEHDDGMKSWYINGKYICHGQTASDKQTVARQRMAL